MNTQHHNKICSFKTISVLFGLLFFGVFIPGWGDNIQPASVQEFLHSINQPTRLIKEAAQAWWSPDGKIIA